MTSSEPFVPWRGALPDISTAPAFRERHGGGSRMSPVEQWAGTAFTSLVDLVMDPDGVTLYGADRGSVGYPVRVTAEWLETWATRTTEPWRRWGMDAPGAWAQVLELLTERVRRRDAAAEAAVPPDARRAAELTAAQRAEQRRADLERQRAEADAELARLDAGVTVPAESPARRGWIRRPGP